MRGHAGEIAFSTVAILGVGLIGGSLGLALKRADSRVHIRGVGRDRARLDLARRMGAIDEFDTRLSGVSDCKLIVLATPVIHILETLETIGPYLSAGALVTDVGSTKRDICRQAERCLPPEVGFIGGHPIAGREVTGVEHSLPGLFENAPYVFCPNGEEHPGGLQNLVQMAKSIGSHPAVMRAEEHDWILARTSHLPQVLSTALASLSLQQEDGGRELGPFSGTGFRDVLRLAGSSYSTWHGILQTNADNVDRSLEEFIQHLERIRRELKQEGLAGDFQRAADFYRRLRKK